METTKVALQKTLDLVKSRGQIKGINISIAEIAKKIGLSEGQLNNYLNGQVNVPNILPGLLWDAYEYLLSVSDEEPGFLQGKTDG